MTGRTNYTAVANTDSFAPPADMTKVYEHFDPLIGETVTTITSLPSSGNWLNRTIMTVDTLWVYVWDGAWQVLSTPWMSYTPVWTSAGGSTAMGASVLTGEYQRRRNVVDFSVYFKLGTGSSQGTGDWRFSLPVAAAASSTGNARVPVAATIENSGVGFYVGAGYINPSDTSVSHIAMNSGTGHMAGGTGGPTWQPNSVIALRGCYQV